MSYKEAVALGVQAAAEAMERLPGGPATGYTIPEGSFS